MTLGRVTCFYCRKEFLKDNRHIKENHKLKHKFFCSPECLSLCRYKKKEYKCERVGCGKRFFRAPGELSSHIFCSKSCAAKFNNLHRIRPVRVLRLCTICNKILVNRQVKYCSMDCHKKGYWDKYPSIHSPELTLEAIKRFVSKNKRLPVKKELNKYYKSARKFFGTWNKTIEAAGFIPNPLLFSKHHIAKDGHICDSLSEKIIDDYLYRHKILHERSIPYPVGTYTADFKVGNKLIEFFGLAGHKRYDELRKIKKRLVKKYDLALIEVYPKDLFPRNQLDKILIFD